MLTNMENIMSNGDLMIGMLYQVHVSQTLSKNPIMHHEFKTVNVDFSKLTGQVVVDCYEKYKQTDQAQLKSSVDFEPRFWAKMYTDTMVKAQNEGKNIARVPNGCCNTPQCGIRKFYEIMHEYCSEIE